MATEPKNYMMWDKESAAKAAKQHKYIFVSEDQKLKKYKLLSGSEKSWVPGKGKQPTNYIYLPNKRLMGLKEHVTAALKAGGVSESEIKSDLKTAYTATNHGADYAAEIEKLNAYKESVTNTQKERIKHGLDDMVWFIDALKDVKEEPIDKATQKASKVSPKSKRDIFRNLYEKANTTGKIIDVSGLETVGGKLRDQPSKKGGKVKSDNLIIETDNVKNYRKAIEWIFGSAENHEADIETVKVRLAEKKKAGVKKAAPKKGAEKSVETPKAVETAEEVVAAPVKKVKKQLGSPRKAALPGSKSPGAVNTRGGENFTSIPPIKK